MTPDIAINALVVVVSAVMSYLAFNRRLTQVESIRRNIKNLFIIFSIQT